MSKSRFGFGTDRETRAWDAKYPEFAVGNGSQIPTAITGEPSEKTTWGQEWHQAPEDSHLWGFALIDYRTLKGNTLASIALDRKSRILVRFKPPADKPEKGISEYEYFFENHGQAVEYFEKMKPHTDPGEIVWEMTRAGVPYRPLKR